MNLLRLQIKSHYRRSTVYLHCCCCFSVAQSFWLFATPWTTEQQASLSLIISCSLPKLMPIASVMASIHFILWWPLFLLLSIFPSIRTFPVISYLHQRMKILEFQHQSFQWVFRVDFPLDWLVWSPWCTGNSQESYPSPKFEGINSLVLHLL